MTTPPEPGPAPCHLRGLSILVTRPSAQAGPLCEQIEAQHGRPIRFPALEIKGPRDAAAARRLLQDLHRCDLLIFVSANAVQYGFPLMPESIPLDLPIAAVGDATARRLDDCGLPATLQPAERLDSEGLLALPELQDMQGKRVLIVRGEGGRPTLGDTLRARGATLDYVEVYRRQRPQRNLCANWDRMVDVVTVTSADILDNLLAMLEPCRTELLQTPLVVVSVRLAEQARALGFRQVLAAGSALDADVLARLCAHARTLPTD